MRRLSYMLALTAFGIAAAAEASPRFLPQPTSEPLAVLIGKSKTIHVLKAESIGPKGVAFKTAAVLKGDPQQAPFSFLANSSCEASLHPAT
ncbi:MAG TPA: hypothetical protein VMS17_03990 [Gemmataceae bacterium]|nr:hypothetical protein [Gemmataceae bacterium]